MVNIFGTAGVRAQVGTAPLNLSQLIQLGQAVGQFIVQKYGPHAKILIAGDTRISSDWIKASFKAGLLQLPVIIVNGQILSTPAIYNLVHRQKRYQAGIMITASHNPYQDNGIKIIDQEHGDLSLIEELQISEFFYASAITPEYNHLGQVLKADADHPLSNYLDQILTQIKFQTTPKELIIWDCANGATSQIIPELSRRLNLNYLVINAQPNGQNINHNCGSTHPSSLMSAVKEHHAKLGFALDGDGDRITVVTANGQIKDGDDLIAFLSTNPDYQDEAKLIGTIVSNYGLELWLNNQSKQLIRSNVGEKHIAIELTKHQAKIGGEPSGHLILKDLASSSDGILVALKVLETASLTGNWSLQTFTRTPTLSENIAIKTKLDLTNPQLANLIKNYHDQIFPGRLVIRYSGTENYLRILLEGPDQTKLAVVLAQIKNELVPLLS
jgi:phosphoglucosamine mutase